MARRIRLDQIGGYSEEKFEQLLRVTVLETDKRLKEESPVDTGRFQLSWVISENNYTEYDAGPRSGSSGIPPAKRMNYQQEQAGKNYHISNSLPYAEPLAGGSSTQAPAGWTERIAREMSDWVRQEAARIARQD